MNVAVVGATGAVGREVLRIFEERDVQVSSLRPVASARSAGKTVPFRGEEIPVTVISDDAFEGIDLALWDTPDEVALEWVPRMRHACINIDNSAAFRMDPDVPLVVPEVNGDMAHDHSGIIANPNCTMVTLLLPLAPLHRAAGALRVICSSYQSTSGAGVAGIDDLYIQLEKMLPERDAVKAGTVSVEPGSAFAHPIAFNVIPHVGSFGTLGETSEERRVSEETNKILSAQIDVFCTAVRVPTVAGHGISAWAQFERPITVDEARVLLDVAPGVTLVDDPGRKSYPTPLQASGGDTALVGRLRGDPNDIRSIAFFSACDNLRKGAALNAVQIAEIFLT